MLLEQGTLVFHSVFLLKIVEETPSSPPPMPRFFSMNISGRGRGTGPRGPVGTGMAGRGGPAGRGPPGGPNVIGPGMGGRGPGGPMMMGPGATGRGPIPGRGGPSIPMGPRGMEMGVGSGGMDGMERMDGRPVGAGMGGRGGGGMTHGGRGGAGWDEFGAGSG